MAKSNKHDWRDPAILLLVIVVVLTNVTWLLSTRDLHQQVDRLGIDNFNNTIQINSLKQCYRDNTDPCPEPTKFPQPE